MKKNRFPALSSISQLLRLVGWLGTMAGLAYAAFEGIYEPFLPGHSFGNLDAAQLAGGIAVAMYSFIGVAFGEVIGVLFAIEENTRSNVDN